jgi:hypothetical protein
MGMSMPVREQGSVRTQIFAGVPLGWRAISHDFLQKPVKRQSAASTGFPARIV